MKDENPWYTAEQKREIAEREVARRLAEYERLRDINADLLAALENLVDACAMGPLDLAAKYGPDVDPYQAIIDACGPAQAAIAKAKP